MGRYVGVIEYAIASRDVALKGMMCMI